MIAVIIMHMLGKEADTLNLELDIIHVFCHDLKIQHKV